MKSLLKKLIPESIIDYYHFLVAIFAAIYYRFPARHLKTIGVTGTKGKSTVVYLVSRILEEAGYKTGAVSSCLWKIGPKEMPNPFHMTMPGRFHLQRLLAQMAQTGCQYAVIEVTSEGIKQRRHWGIDFSVAALTNLAPEHLERHGGFENYKKAKGELFKNLRKDGISIINLDCEQADFYLDFPAHEKWGVAGCHCEPEQGEGVAIPVSILDQGIATPPFGRLAMTVDQGIASSPSAPRNDIRVIAPTNIRCDPEGIHFNYENLEFFSLLIGEFNVSNVLMALAICLSQNIPLATIQKALAKIQSPAGRMEIVSNNKGFTLIVDLAHTPDSFRAVMETVKKYWQPNRLIAVFGSAGGGRDKWKRPVLAQTAGKYCDEIIITTEDSYEEKPEQIIEEISRGLPQNFQIGKNFWKITDRRKAISFALKQAKPGDALLFLGKGTEPTIVYDTGSLPWNEREVILEEMEKMI